MSGPLRKDNASSTVQRRATHHFKSGPRAGTTMEFGALAMRDFIQLRDKALDSFKQARIRTWTENVEMMAEKIPEERRVDWIMNQLEKAALRAEDISHEDLPKKTMRLPDYLPNGKVKRDAQKEPVFVEREVEYAMWWMSDDPEGKLHATWLSARKCEGQTDLTLDDVDALFVDAQEELEKVAQKVGAISKQELGNPEPSAETVQPARELTEATPGP